MRMMSFRLLLCTLLSLSALAVGAMAAESGNNLRKTIGEVIGEQQPMDVQVWEKAPYDLKFHQDIFHEGRRSDAVVEGFHTIDKYGKVHNGADPRGGDYQEIGGLRVKIRTPPTALYTASMSDGGFHGEVYVEEDVDTVILRFDYRVKWKVTGPDDEGKIVAQIGDKKKDLCDEVPCFGGADKRRPSQHHWNTATLNFGTMEAGIYTVALGTQLFHTANSPGNQTFSAQFYHPRVVAYQLFDEAEQEQML